MENLNKLLENIQDIDHNIYKQAQKRWDKIAKPIQSLGKMEDIISKSMAILGATHIEKFKKCVVIMCADNGIIEEGISQTDSSVTSIVAENMANDQAIISIISKSLGGDTLVVDIGMKNNVKNTNILVKKEVNGTKNFIKTDAMTKSECENAILVGINLVKQLKNEGYNLIATGEMGIGNTTTSSALASVLLDLPVEKVTGKGAGLSDTALLHKIDIIKKGITARNANKSDIFELICKIGGLDIAGMCGIFLGGAIYKIPILIDGFISSVSALLAVKLNFLCLNYMFATHISSEPAGKILNDALNLPFIIDADMRLGEGSGAVMSYPFFDTALAIFNKMSTFEDIKVTEYESFE